MYPFDAISNFGYGAVSTAPSPATSGTTLKMTEAQSDNFPDPATNGEYNVTVWPTGVQPLYSNSEIVRFTAKAAPSGGEVQFTIEREQESTPARTIIVGDQLALTETVLARQQIFDAIISGFYEDKLLASQSFTRNSASQFTTPGDKTTYYVAGRLIKFHDGSLAIVSSSSYSAPDTTVNIIAASGTVPTSPTNVYIGIGRIKLLDEDDMASDSALAPSTQQAIKAYVDNLVDRLANAGNEPFTQNSMARQAVMNGNFDIWQRNTTFTNPSTSTYMADRWRNFINLDGGTPPSNIVISRQAQTPGDLAGSFYFLRVAPDGAGSGYGVNADYTILQRIEHGTRMLAGNGKTITMSFWARSSISGKKLGVGLGQGYGSGGTPTSLETIIGDKFTLTSSWQKFTITFTTNTLSGKTFGTNNDDYLQIAFSFMWGSTRGANYNSSGVAENWASGTIDIAQVQVCAGDVALPFQPKSFGEELRACQRYYRKSFPYATVPAQNAGVSGAPITTLVKAGANTVRFWALFPVPMRVAPTITLYNPSAANAEARDVSNNLDCSSTNSTNTDNENLRITTVSHSSSTEGAAIQIHYQADAEL